MSRRATLSSCSSRGASSSPYSLLTTHCLPLTTHHSPLTTHHSPLTAHTHHSPHHSPLTLTTHLTTHHSPPRPAIDSSSHAHSAPPPARKPPPPPSKPAAALVDSLSIRLPEDERIKRYMDAASSVADSHGGGGCASCLRAATPAVSLLVWLLVKVAPLYLWLFRKARWFYSWAPTNLLQMCPSVLKVAT